jgi:hypothetical protein
MFMYWWQALGDRKGIHRFGEFSAPLDEALTHVVGATLTLIELLACAVMFSGLMRVMH